MQNTMLGWIEAADARFVFEHAVVEKAPKSEIGPLTPVLAILAVLGCSMLLVSLALSSKDAITAARLVQYFS